MWPGNCTISIGFSSQWNFGKKIHSCPASLIRVSSIEGWLIKSSCCDMRQARQHFWLSNGQTGEHFALSPFVLKPHSSRTACNPFASPEGVVICCGFPQNCGSGFVTGITVSCYLRCFPPLDLFMSNAWRASDGREACAEDWSNTNTAWHPGWAASKISIADLTWAINWLLSHQGSPLEPGKIILRASWIIFPLLSCSMSQPLSLFIKSETWMSLPWPFFLSGCSPSWSLNSQDK